MTTDLRDYLWEKYGAGTPVLERETALDMKVAERRKYAAKGWALPDGSFPINNAAQLKDAIRLVGNAKDPAKAKAHIIKRAEALGLTSMLPKGWDAGKDKESKGETEKAFVLHADSGRTIITAPLREIAQVNEGFTYLRGRYVEADNPNQNGAMWTTADLEMGAPTVAGGPLNWLHQERKIIGTLLDGALQSGREAADGEPAIGNHIVSNAVLWNFLFPNEALTVQRASDQGEAYFSMECLSRQVACVGDLGCGETFDYADYNSKRTCQHLREKSSVRRFVDPYFLGAAVIVPPIKPGWANANLETLGRQNAEAVERAQLEDHLSKSQAEAMVSALLAWANR